MPWMPYSNRPRTILGPMPGSFIKPCRWVKPKKHASAQGNQSWQVIFDIMDLYKMICGYLWHSAIWHGNFMGFNQQASWLGIGFLMLCSSPLQTFYWSI
jgi:hypothetical protein